MTTGISTSPRAQLDPPGFTYFFDSTNMIKALADALHQRGRLVRTQKQVFPDGTEDRLWIPEVAARGWIIVTRDRRLQHRHVEWMAFLRAKARVIWNCSFRAGLFALHRIRNLRVMRARSKCNESRQLSP